MEVLSSSSLGGNFKEAPLTLMLRDTTADTEGNSVALLNQQQNKLLEQHAICLSLGEERRGQAWLPAPVDGKCHTPPGLLQQLCC